MQLKRSRRLQYRRGRQGDWSKLLLWMYKALFDCVLVAAVVCLKLLLAGC